MRKHFLQYIAIFLIGAVLVMAGGWAFVNRLSQAEWWEEVLQQQLGYAVSIDGPVRVQFFPSLSFDIGSIRSQDGILASRLHVRFDPFASLAGYSGISEVTFYGLRVPVRHADLSSVWNNLFSRGIPVLKFEDALLTLTNSSTISLSNATVKAGTETSALHAEGSARWHGHSIRFAGKVGHETTAGAGQMLTFSVSSSLLRGRYSGMLERDFRLKGRAELTIPSPGVLWGAMDGNTNDMDPLPPDEIQINGNLVLNAGSLIWSDLHVQTGASMAGGNFRLDFDTRPKVALSLEIPYLQTAAAEDGFPGRSLLEFPVRGLLEEVSRLVRHLSSFDSDLVVKIGSVALSRGVVHDVQINAESSPEGLRFHHLSAVLPGGTALSGVGIMRDGAMDLTMEVASDDARSLLEWADGDTSFLYPGRLHRLWMRGDVRVSPQEISISPISIEVDTVHADAGVTIALTERPAFGLSVAIDALPLDAYLPATMSLDDAFQAARSVLRSADFNVKGKIGHVSYGPAVLHEMTFDASALNGMMRWRIDADAAEEQETALHSEGDVSLSDEGKPWIDSLSLEARLPTPLALWTGTSVSFPLIDASLGSCVLAVTAKGSADALELVVSGALSGLHMLGQGKLDATRRPMPLTGTLALTHASLPQMAELVGLSYSQDEPGGFFLSAQIDGVVSQFEASDLRLRLGPVNLAGKADFDAARGKDAVPFLSTTLHAADIPLSSVVPSRVAPSVVDLRDRTGAPSAQARPWREGGTVTETSLFDFPFSPYMRFAVQIDAENMSFGRWRFPSPHVVFRSGREATMLSLSSQSVFGGQASLVLNAREEGGMTRLNGSVAAEGIDIRQIHPVLGATLLDEGEISLSLDLESRGRDIDEAFSTLEGQGSASLENVVFDGLNLAAFGALDKKASGVTSIDTIFSGKGRVSHMESSLSLVGMSLRMSAILPLPEGSEGFFSGRVGLREGELDGTLALRLPRYETAPPLRVMWTGTLDAPRRTVETSSFEKWWSHCCPDASPVRSPPFQ